MKKQISIVVLMLVTIAACHLKSNKNQNIWMHHQSRKTKVEIPGKTPGDAPFKKSKYNIVFTGRYANYTKADTWYPSWASDDHLYSPWTDGSIGADGSFSGGPDAKTGHAKIEGDNPLDLKITNLGVIAAKPEPYHGRYPCGSLVYNGIWYYGTYTLTNSDYEANWPVLGPFAGFRVSYDLGKSWVKSPASCFPGQTLFPEPDSIGGPLKIGAPHFVDFGKNMEHSPDGYAYLISHGATEPDKEDRIANLSWITGDHIYLSRVKPSPETINNEEAYDYFAGHDEEGNAIWSSDYSKIIPLVDWDNNTGCVTMTYNAPLKKYFMCVTNGWPTIKTMNTYILESDNLTGPFIITNYWEKFGPQAYFVNIPSKFISKDGRTMWLCYSGNFTNGEQRNTEDFVNSTTPPGSAYSLSLHEIAIK
ncbi:MAG: hypothetical protein JEZ14_01850 [Marinilabiliaceae bacterium]|nr:hypothetical protein [Marinilabiliaceae bacterium]